MSFGLVFWILMLLWFVFSLWSFWSPLPHGIWVNSLFLFILFLLLGWKVFGAPLHP